VSLITKQDSIIFKRKNVQAYARLLLRFRVDGVSKQEEQISLLCIGNVPLATCYTRGIALLTTIFIE